MGSRMPVPSYYSCLKVSVICRLAVLDGGYPAWKAGGHPLDSDPVDDGAVDGAAQAAANPPASTKYPAKLQVSFPQ